MEQDYQNEDFVVIFYTTSQCKEGAVMTQQAHLFKDGDVQVSSW